MTPPSEHAAGRLSSAENDEKRASNERATWNKLTSSLSEKRRKTVPSVHGVQDEEFDPGQADDVNVAENGGNGGMFSEAELERLGRERPACFPNIWHEIAFSFSLVMSQVLAVR